MRSSSIVILGSAVLALAAASSASAQIVTNGGFETGDFSGWTGVGNNGFQGVASGGVEHSGTFGAFFGPVGSVGGISQTIATTAGDTYTFSFWLQDDGGAPSSFEADWNGASVFSLSNAPNQPFTLESFSRRQQPELRRRSSSCSEMIPSSGSSTTCPWSTTAPAEAV